MRRGRIEGASAEHQNNTFRGVGGGEGVEVVDSAVHRRCFGKVLNFLTCLQYYVLQADLLLAGLLAFKLICLQADLLES